MCIISVFRCSMLLRITYVYYGNKQNGLFSHTTSLDEWFNKSSKVVNLQISFVENINLQSFILIYLAVWNIKCWLDLNILFYMCLANNHLYYNDLFAKFSKIKDYSLLFTRIKCNVAKWLKICLQMTTLQRNYITHIKLSVQFGSIILIIEYPPHGIT